MNIFISYRRADSQDLAGRIADRLKTLPHIGKVFIDVESIAPGDDFTDRIRTAMEESSICLVVIGPCWRGDDSAAPQPRIFDERDFVRQEVREALQSKAKTVPILANGAVMPSPTELPPDLHQLSIINGLALRHSYFDHDFALLHAAIFPTQGSKRQSTLLAMIGRAAMGMITALFALVVILGIVNQFTGLSLDQLVGGSGMAVLTILAVLATGASLPLVFRRRP